ncbi:MAG: hypothetical protein JJU45_15595 [Acidimicrobiia bacterium]|nr:hypothetical protein [Acidimicrobiia bacterium]
MLGRWKRSATPLIALVALWTTVGCAQDSQLTLLLEEDQTDLAVVAPNPQVSCDAAPNWFDDLDPDDPLDSMQLPENWVGNVDLVLPEAPSGGLPLIVQFHGLTGNRSIVESNTGLAATGSLAGYAVLTPDAPSERGGWPLAAGSEVEAHVLALLDSVTEQLCTDPDRVFAAGFSNGAMFAKALSCRHPERLTAVASVAGLVHIDDCEHQPNAALLAVHGRHDQIVGFDGAHSAAVALLVGHEEGPPVPQLASDWAARHGCSDDVEDADDHDAVEVARQWRCPDHVEVVLVVVDEGHRWPSESSTGVDATALIIRFFNALA